jgi:hypothetical protein
MKNEKDNIVYIVAPRRNTDNILCIIKKWLTKKAEYTRIYFVSLDCGYDLLSKSRYGWSIFSAVFYRIYLWSRLKVLRRFSRLYH